MGGTFYFYRSLGGTAPTSVTNVAGINYLRPNAGDASAYLTAIAGAGTVGNITGIVSTLFSGTTSGAAAPTGISRSYGIDYVNAQLASADASVTTPGSVAAGAAGKASTIVGESTEVVTGVTTGAGASDVYGDSSIGLLRADVAAGMASAYLTATAGTGTVGAITGTSVITLTKGTTAGNGSVVDANSNFGSSVLTLDLGNAYASTAYAKSVATAAAGVVGAISGTASFDGHRRYHRDGRECLCQCHLRPREHNHNFRLRKGLQRHRGGQHHRHRGHLR